MTKERKIKTKNIFSVLLEEDTEPWEEEEPPQIVKIDEDEKKIYKGKGRGSIRSALRERKGESETGLIPGLPKNCSNKGIQNKNRGLLRCKSAKCYNEYYTY